MSKNTGTSELINYFDLGVNGDVGISGSLTLDTIANATTDTDTFLVSDTGIIKYRTGAQLLSDIGAAPAVAGGYVPYTGATTNVDLGVYNLTASAIIANGSGSNAGIVHLESNAIHSLVNGYGSIASGTTNQFNLYQTTGAGVFRGAILSLNSITASAIRTYTLPDADGTLALTSQIPANPVGGTGTSGTIPVFTGSTTIGNSIIQSNATQVNVVGNGSQLLFDSLGQSKSGGIYYINSFELLINNSRGTGSAIYLGNTNLDFHTNVSGNPRLRITDGGNILIGTTDNNGAKLQVNGGVTITNSVGGTTTSNYLQIEGSTANNTNYPGILFKGGTLVTTYPSISLSNGGIALILNQGSSATYPNTSQISLNNGAITLSTGSTLSPRLTVNELGNVGIGETSPAVKLHIVGTTQMRFDTTSSGSIIQFWKDSSASFASSIGNSIPGGSLQNDLLFSTYNGSSWSERMRITSGGNVGIGTASPPSRLSVQWDKSTLFAGAAIYDSQAFNVSNHGGTVAFGGTFNSGGSYTEWSAIGGMKSNTTDGNVSGDINFYTRLNSSAMTERMRITSGGNVLIGSPPAADNGTRLQVSGNATINGSGNTLLVNSDNNSLALGVGFQGITSGYIGGISSALYGYSTNGGYVLLNSSSAWVPASDIKRKRNFEPYTKGISAILGLQPKLYNMDFQKDGDEKQVGLVAQEVREFIPLAYEENADFIGINYNAIIVTMVKAIQELKQQLDTLTNENN